jgi:hypothetical protein
LDCSFTNLFFRISGDKKSLNLDYLPFLRQSLTEPLVKKEAEGVPDVIKLLDDYDIVKDDFDNIMDITKWPNSKDPLSQLSTKVRLIYIYLILHKYWNMVFYICFFLYTIGYCTFHMTGIALFI